jgi:DDE family transposase
VLKRAASGLLEQARSLYRSKHVRASQKQAKAHRQQQQARSKREPPHSQQQERTRSHERLKAKLYTTFASQAASWSPPHRIICKAAVSEEGETLRCVVTNMQTPRNQWIDETISCGRGQMENYIKDHKLFLHADRTSCHQFAAHQLRVFLPRAAYVLMHTLRTTGLQGTAWGKAPCDQMPMRLLKVGARVEALKTKVQCHFPSAFPLQELYQTVLANLSRTDLCRSPSAMRRLARSISSDRWSWSQRRAPVRPRVRLGSDWQGIEPRDRVAPGGSNEENCSSRT